MPLRIAAALIIIIASAALLAVFRLPAALAENSATVSGVPDRIMASGDLDCDGISETYLLEGHVLAVTENERELWKSPEGYTIDCFALGDIDNNGTSNLVFSLWKKGSFGRNHPFWHTGRDESYKNHLFIYKLEDDSFRQVWCSSDLDHPILSFEIRDRNNDNENELVTVEGEYKKITGDRYEADPDGKKQTTIWEWSGWGFQTL
jgi:poly-gamma-glutamate synthesis protein (capsule biosynthesis protein)